MTLINFLIFITLVTIIINQINIETKTKILLNVICYIIYIKLNHSNLQDTLEVSVIYFNYMYIVLNIFTTRFSSIRIRIIEELMNEMKVIDEEQLYIDRNERLNNKLQSKFLLNMITSIILIFRKILIK